MQFKILFFLDIYIIVCNQHNFSEALVGEHVRQAEKSEFPFIVSIMNTDNNWANPEIDHICTGSLITIEHVLTAAHCLENRSINQTSIIAGSVDLYRGRLYKIRAWMNFVEWAERKKVQIHFRVNDVAIVKIIEQVNARIATGFLSPISTVHLYGKDVVLAGWGVTNNNQTSTNLLTANAKILSSDECANRVSAVHGSAVHVHVRHLCSVADPYILQHYGDSGGPLMYQNMIVGVSKSTVPLAHIPIHPKKINIHTSINYYKNFILDVISNDFKWY